MIAVQWRPDSTANWRTILCDWDTPERATQYVQDREATDAQLRAMGPGEWRVARLEVTEVLYDKRTTVPEGKH